MAVNNGTLGQEVNGKVEYLYPKTSAELVEYDADQSIKDKINDINKSIDNINNRITTITDFLDGYENSEDQSNIVVDSVLDISSTNPVQNKAITEELNKKASKQYVNDEISKINTGGGIDNNTSSLKFININGDVISDFKNATNNGIPSTGYLSVFRSDPNYIKINSNQEAVSLIAGVDIHEGDIIKIEVVHDDGVTITITDENGINEEVIYKDENNNTYYKQISNNNKSYEFTTGANIYIKYSTSGAESKSGIAFTTDNVNGYMSIDPTKPEVLIGGGAGDTLLWMKKLAFFDDITNNILELIYPVGSIYLNVNNINPGSFLGGVWESWGSGRVPVGVDANNENFKKPEMTGGESTHILLENELPKHAHNIPAHSHSLGDHTHDIPAHSHSLGDHTHTIPAHNHNLGNHTHTIPAHNHNLGNHTHTIPAHSHSLGDHTHEIIPHNHKIKNHQHEIPILDGIINTTGDHNHSISSTAMEYKYTPGDSTLIIDKLDTTYNNENEIIYNVSDDGIHTHTVSTNPNKTGNVVGDVYTEDSESYTSGESNGNTGDSEVITSGESNGNTGDSEVITSGESNGNTGDSEVVISNSVGAGIAHNNLQPYITCYMWKRIM